MELITFNKDELEIAEEYKEKLRSFMKLKKEIEGIEQDLKKLALTYMQDNDFLELDSEVMKIKYVAPFTRKSVDTEKLKEHGLYDEYSKETTVSPSVRIIIK